MNVIWRGWRKCRRLIPTRGQCQEFLYRRVLKRPLRFRDLHGLVYEFGPDEAFAGHLDRGSVVDDPSLSRFVERTVKAGDTVLDVGANIGGISLLAGRLTGETGRVVAFEPEAENFRQLARNIALNGLNSRITPINQAVYSTDRPVEFHVFDRPACGWNTIGWFELAGHAPKGTVTIQAVTLDGFCHAHGIGHIHLLKVDVEGAEPEVLSGARQLLATRAIERVVFEVSLPPLRGMKHEVEDTLTPLTEAGYDLAALEADGALRAVSADEIKRTFFGNYVASSPDCLARRPVGYRPG